MARLTSQLHVVSAVAFALAGTVGLNGQAIAGSCNTQQLDPKGLANAAVSLNVVKTCASVFQIKASLLAEFRATVKAACLDNGKPLAAMPLPKCENDARVYFAGPQTLRFLELTPAAAERLQVSQ